jgi:hypothetical protein
MFGALPRFTLQPARAAHLIEIQLQPRDAFIDEALVDFKLRLARPAEKTETAALAFKMRP